MNVSNIGIAAYGSAAIASPPADNANVKRDQSADSSPAQQIIEAAKSADTGQVVDKTV